MLAMDEQVQTMNIEEKRVVVEPTKALVDISLDENNPERCTRVGADLERKIKEDLVQFLKKNIDVFAWSHEDMPGIDPNFIWEVYYLDWLANVVMVKKANGNWRMCVDFTDLNKACPKDSYPLPRIDQLVDSTTRHKLLCFIDAFSRYNQIRMDRVD